MALEKTIHSGYYKDANSGAVINNNEDEFRLYKSQREQFIEFNKMKRELSSLSSDVEQLKKLLLGKN